MIIIKLKNLEGYDLYVNAEQIESIYQVDHEHTEVMMVSGRKNTCVEPPEEIISRLLIEAVRFSL